MLIDAKSLTDLINKQLSTWQSLLPNANISPDSMIYIDANVIAEVLYLLQADAITLTNNAFLAYAAGDELSNLGLDRGIARLAASSSTGTVTFARHDIVQADYPIPAGALVSTQAGINGAVVPFQTTTAATLFGQILAPTGLTITPSSTGGSIGASTVDYVVTSVGGDGKETDQSTNATYTFASGSTNSVSLTWTAASRAYSYNVYVKVSGTYKLLANVAVPSYVDTTGTSASSTTPPVSNGTGNLSVDVAVSCSIAGSVGNVAANTVSAFISKPTGIETVINNAAMTGGVDEETDDVYRARIQSELSNNTGKGTVNGYKELAMSVAGVASATIVRGADGTVDANDIDIYITSNTGDGVPDSTLLSAVAAVVTSDANRLVCDDVTVNAPTTYAVDVTASITSYDSVTYTSAQITAAITANLNTFLLTIPMNGTVRMVDIQNVIHDTAGVIDFSMSVPSSNHSLGTTDIAIPGTYTFTYP